MAPVTAQHAAEQREIVKGLIAGLCLILVASLQAADWAHAAALTPRELRPEVEAFVIEMSERHGFSVSALRTLMLKARTQEAILRAMARPGTARPWFEYRPRYVNPLRVADGLEFWADNAGYVARASQRYGVPQEIIVATLGVETSYGRDTGKFRVLDALYTLAFDWPPRAEYFRSELEQFLLLAREQGIDPLQPRGSYAGAMGIAQFMPSSYRKYAVDFDGSGRPDLARSADAIGSVANYMSSFGWTPGGPVAVAADAGGERVTEFVDMGLEPKLSVEALAEAGIRPQAAVPGTTQAALLRLQGEEGPLYFLGFNNFYVITRYNRSVNYAMSLFDLAEELAAARGRRRRRCPGQAEIGSGSSLISPFSIARLPRMEFGAGTLRRLPDIMGAYGTRALLVTGQSSFDASKEGAWLCDTLCARGFTWEQMRVAGEPSPQLVDDAVAHYRRDAFDVVVGMGGGSALDAAKAIAGLLRPGNSVMDHLEGVGPELPYWGQATPFIAVPTTAGTGSEATKNAVLSVHGETGFKKSFRDDRLVAEWAIVDPDLLAGCPRELIAADGMDAFTQLLEAFVSLRANPFTDALARSGITAVKDGLLDWYAGGEPAVRARERMAYASLLSGICLAQTGLGSVHGLAAPLGAFFPIPHGVACGTTVAAATRINIAALLARDPDNVALAKYAEVGRCLSAQAGNDDMAARDGLLAVLDRWQEALKLPRLSHYAVKPDDVPRIVAASRGSSMKTNPIVLTDVEVAEIVTARL